MQNEPQIIELPHDPNTEWNDEQKLLVKEYLELIEDAFEALPNNGRFYFSHAAEVLRHVARKFD